MIAKVSVAVKDLIKHLFLFQVLFDVCLIATVGWLIHHLERQLPWGWWR